MTGGEIGLEELARSVAQNFRLLRSRKASVFGQVFGECLRHCYVRVGKANEVVFVQLCEAYKRMSCASGWETEREKGEAEIVPVDHEFAVAQTRDEDCDRENWDCGWVLDQDEF